jgi:hypothetical protein
MDKAISGSPSLRGGRSGNRDRVARFLLNDDDLETSDQRAQEAEEEVQTGLMGHCTNENAKFLSLFLLFTSATTAELLLRKTVTTLYMKNYLTFLNLQLCIVATIVFGSLVLINNWRSDGDHQESPLNCYFFLWYLVISVFDTLALYMILLAAAHVTPDIMNVLSQGVIPITMALSYIYLKKTFHTVHKVGAFVIIVGICLALGSSKSDPNDASSVHETNFGWGIVYFCSTIPMSITGILREKVLTDPDVNKRASENSLNAWVAVIQIGFALLFSPLAYVLQSNDGNARASDTLVNLGDGWKCWAEGINTIVNATNPQFNDDCAGAFWVTNIQVFIVIIVNILILTIISQGSAVIFFIATAVTVPLTAIVGSLPFMGTLQTPLSVFDVLSIVLVLAGVVIYRQREEGPPGGFEGGLLDDEVPLEHTPNFSRLGDL